MAGSDETALAPAATVELEDLARLAGERWATACARRLRAQHRDVEGAWPGTVSEAYGRLIEDHAVRLRALPSQEVRALSRITYRAARTAWNLLTAADERR